MAYQVPTLDGMLSFVVAMFKGLLPTRNIGSRFTINWRLAKVIAAAVTDLHANLAASLTDAMPDSARGPGLDRWLYVAAPGGLTTRKGATPARRSNAARVTGAAAVVIPAGTLLLHRKTSLRFAVNEAAVIPVGGTIDVDIVAFDTGSRTRLEAGEVLELVTPIAGMNSKLELQLALTDDGVDAELDGTARNRLLAALATHAAGGTQADYVGWALAQLGISNAFVYPNRAGLGTVDVVGFHAGSGTSRFLSPAERASLLSALLLLAPSGVAGTNSSNGLRVLTAVGGTDPANLANVEMLITPNGAPQFAFDWDDSAPPVVLSWMPGTRKLRFTAPRPASMAAGHRLSLKGIASSQDGAPMIIETLDVATDTVVLQLVPPVGPAATDVAYSGGPLVEGLRNAILAHINGEVLYSGADGPLAASTIEDDNANYNVLVDGIGSANPDGLSGTWKGSLQLGALATIATYTRGVRRHTTVTPATDLEAVDYAFPLDDQIGVLTPGYVLVRRG